jgi:hypothetical protein
VRTREGEGPPRSNRAAGLGPCGFTATDAGLSVRVCIKRNFENYPMPTRPPSPPEGSTPRDGVFPWDHGRDDAPSHVGQDEVLGVQGVGGLMGSGRKERKRGREKKGLGLGDNKRERLHQTMWHYPGYICTLPRLPSVTLCLERSHDGKKRKIAGGAGGVKQSPKNGRRTSRTRWVKLAPWPFSRP